MPEDSLVWSDLAALGSSPLAVKEQFQAIWGVEPDGIALNDTTYFNAPTPPITLQDDNFCYKTLGDIDYADGALASGPKTVVGSNAASNDSDSPVTISLIVDGNWLESVRWSSSITAGMSFTRGFDFAGNFGTGSPFAISTTVGESKKAVTTRTSSITVSVTVPPRSMVRVDMVATMAIETIAFTAPIQVTGVMGANFPDRVDGHYFQFAEVSALLPLTSATFTGTVRGTMATDVQTVIGQARPISSG